MTNTENESIFTEIAEEESATVSGGVDLNKTVAVSLPTGSSTGPIFIAASLQNLRDKLNQQQDSKGVGLGDSILNQISELKNLGKL